MALYPITRVGNIDDSVVNEPSLKNTSQGIAPSGISAIALTTAILSQNKTTDFHFTELNQPYPNRFVFDGAIVQSRLGGFDGSLFGMAEVRNLAHGISVVSIASEQIKYHVVSSSASQVDFNFTDTLIKAEPYFHFGDTVINNVGDFDGSAIGELEVEQTLSIKTISIDDVPFDSNAFITNVALHHDFIFDTPLYQTANHNFVFGGGQLFKPTGLLAQSFGLSSIANVAQGLTAQGAFDSVVNVPIVQHARDKKYNHDFIFLEGVRKADARNLPFHFYANNEINNIGFVATQFGNHRLKNLVDKIFAGVGVASRYGTAVFTQLDNAEQTISPRGFGYTYFGEPIFDTNEKYINVGNIDELAFGTPKLILALQFITIREGIKGSYGRLWISLFRRNIDAKGTDFGIVGKHWISYQTRFISPVGIYGNKGKDWETNHAVGGEQSIILDNYGFVATRFGERIIPEISNIYIERGIATEFPMPTVGFKTRYLAPRSFNNHYETLHSERFGKLQIYNSVQYIYQYFIQNSGLTPQILDPDDPTSISDFGKYTAIYNNNRTVTAYSIDATRFGYHEIYNNARLIGLKDNGITGDIGLPLVAYRIRYLPLEGLEPQHFSYWHTIRNAARVIAPKAIQDTAFGLASLVNTRRYFNRIGNFESQEFGLPMVADRIRTISIEPRHSIHTPLNNLPYVGLYTRYIEPKGFHRINAFSNKFGTAYFFERFNRITTRWYHRDYIGYAELRNVTPELRLYGHNSAEFGDTHVRLEFRTVVTLGNVMSLFGNAIIADRTKKIRMVGIDASFIPRHTVTRMSAPPYSLQYIELRKFTTTQQGTVEWEQGYGIWHDHRMFGRAYIRTNVLIPRTILATEFGSTTVSANSITMNGGFAIENFSDYHRVWVATQYIHVKEYDAKEREQVSWARISPHTIYAPSSDMATAQARNNHKKHTQEYINTGVKFGRLTINNQHRQIHQYNVGTRSQQEFGTPYLKLAKHYISPKGFRGSYFGIPMIPFVPQTIKQFWGTEEAVLTAYGVTKISHTNYETRQWIKPRSFNQVAIGNPLVEYFHRTIYPKGSLMQLLGGPFRGVDTPFMWQGLRVGERVLGNYGGYETQLFGTAFISLKIRQIDIQGFDNFISQTDVKYFKERLRVIRVPLSTTQNKAFNINADGFDGLQIGIHDVKNNVHYIKPDGNSEQFRKGAW